MSHCTSLGRRKGIAKTKQRIAAIFSLFHITPPWKYGTHLKRIFQKPTQTMKNGKSCKALPTKIRTQTSNWQVNQETRQNRESFETRDIPQTKGVNQDSSNKRRCHIGLTSLHVFAWDHAACSRNHDGMNCLERLHKWCRAWYLQWQIPSCHDLRGQIYRGVSWRKDFACTSIVSWNMYLPFKKKKLNLNIAISFLQ
jgi:hypothetical protein